MKTKMKKKVEKVEVCEEKSSSRSKSSEKKDSEKLEETKVDEKKAEVVEVQDIEEEANHLLTNFFNN